MGRSVLTLELQEGGGEVVLMKSPKWQGEEGDFLFRLLLSPG